MRIVLGNRERLTAPAEYQEILTEKFGLNRFDQPNFKLVWGQTETQLAATGEGYREIPMCSNKPCWCVMKWFAPESWGTPETWYMENFDKETGLLLLGPYPERGKYVEILPLMNTEYVEGRTICESLPLNSLIMDMVVPLIVKAQNVCLRTIQNNRQEMEEAKERAISARIRDRLLDACPSYLGPVSYAGQTSKNSHIQKKIEEIEKQYANFSISGMRKIPKGIFQFTH